MEAPYTPAPGTGPGVAPGPAPQAPQPPQAPTRQPSGWGKLWASFGFAVLAMAITVAIQIVLLVFSMLTGTEQELANPAMAVYEIVGGAFALLFIVALGGKSIAKPSTKGMGEAWKAAGWMFIVDGVLVVIEIVEVVTGAEPFDVAADWPIRMLVLVFLCLGVGLSEETMVRGLCLNGFLARFGRTRKGVYGAAIVSALIFGFMHYDFTIGFDDPLLVAQNFMKVMQTAIVGYLFAAILVKTRNMWTVVIIHAANDFMLMFLAYGMANEAVTTDYVATGDEGVATLVVYVLLCLMYSPLLVIATRMIREASPWRGDFYHYGPEPLNGQEELAHAKHAKFD